MRVTTRIVFFLILAIGTSCWNEVVYAQGPAVSGVSPEIGPVGTLVTISGSNFGASQGSSTVTFGGASATVSAWSATQISATVPATAHTGPVQVTVGGVASNTSVYFNVPGPHVSSVTPSSGVVGTQVTIAGTGFQASKGSSSITFYGGTASVSSWSDTQIIATVPNGASSGAVSVTVQGVQSNVDVVFSMPNPIVQNLTPSIGPVGTQVQVNGYGFGATQGSSTITFNGVTASIVSWSDTQVVATVPTTATSGAVQVNVGGVGSNSSYFFTVPVPQVNSVTPSSGGVGTQVTISGTGFQSSKGSSQIYFNGYGATVSSWSDTQIIAPVPSGAATGPVSVTVNGQASNQDVVFSMPNPKVQGLVPSIGPVGTQVQVNGYGFGATQGSGTVKLSNGGVTANVVSWSDTQIVVTVPSTTTTGWVQVTAGGVASNSSVYFTVPAPQVSSVTPNSGGVGTQVTITGTGFQASKGSSYVQIGGQVPTTTSWSDTQIIATVPSGATSGPVSVRVNGLTSNQDVVFSMPNPQVQGLMPTLGPVGTQVQVNGVGFGATQGSSTVKFSNGGVTPSVVSWSDTQIVVTLPSTTTTGWAQVTVGGVTSNTSINFTVPAPRVSNVTPSSGGVGTQVTITGTGFQANKGSSSIYINGYSATVSSWSDTQIIATVPNGASNGPVTVIVNGVVSNRDIVFSMPGPIITDIWPINGTTGTTVQVNGIGFGATQGSGTVSFYGYSASVISWSDTQIVATVPSGMPNTQGLVQVQQGNVGSNATVYFTKGSLLVSSVLPRAAVAGTQVTVSGIGFGTSQGTSSIMFNGTAASIVSWSDTQIVATVPAGVSTGPVKVTVGTSNSNTDVVFTASSVSVDSVSPTYGSNGTQVTINGAGFGATQGSSTVSFNNKAAQVVTWSDTQITATVANGSTTGSVTVNVGGVGSNTTQKFTVPAPVVRSLSPTSGPVGTQVQVNGYGFGATQGTSTISFGSVVSWSDTLITVTIPTSLSTGIVQVSVGGVNSNGNIYFTVPAPQVSSVAPASGVVGTQLTITGTGFQAARGTLGNVIFDGGGGSGRAATIVSWSDTQIAATVPVGARTGYVRVTANNNQPSNMDVSMQISYPIITTLSPSSGPVGTQVQVNGSGFGATQGSSTITINGTSVPVVSWSDTQILVTIPNSQQTGTVLVSVNSMPSNGNLYFTVPAPMVNSVTPANGVAGTQVTIAGTGFQAVRGNGNVYFYAGGNASIVSWNDTQIVATLPSGSQTGYLQVTANNNQSSNKDVSMVITAVGVTMLSPSSGPVGTQVQVNGYGFGATQGTSTITFNSTSVPVVSWSNTQITVTVPTNVSSGPVQVTTQGIVSNNNINFTVPAPMITGITPTSGVVGTQVTLAGTGFQAAQGAGAVTFYGQTNYPQIVSWSDTQIVATVPPSSSGWIQVRANNNAGSNQNVGIVLPNPVISTLSPSSGPVGSLIQINGFGFGATQGSSVVYFWSTPAMVMSWSDTQISAIVPLTAGTNRVSVTVNGVSSNLNIIFTVPPPFVSGVSPKQAAGGSSITITGSNFGPNTGAILFPLCANAGAGTTSWSDTQIIATVPSIPPCGPFLVYHNNMPSNYVNFTIPPNWVNTISPVTGPVGTSVTISGSGFGATQGTSTVKFNGQLASAITSWSDTQIVATVPVTASTGPAIVNVNGLDSNNTVTFTIPPPHITGISPLGGPVDSSVTITGSGFQPTQRDSTIKINGTAATATSWSDTQIIATVPSLSTSGPVTVTVNGINSNSDLSFTVAKPAITSLSPPSGAVGGTVILNGSGYGTAYNAGGNSSVSFNGAGAQIMSWTDTAITVLVPSGATSGPVTLTLFGVTSSPVNFTVENPPVITSISPAIAPAGSNITLTGSGFGDTQSNSTAGFYGDGALGTIVSWSDTQIVMTVPQSATGGPVWVNVAALTGYGPSYAPSHMVTVVDSLFNSTQYTVADINGQMLMVQSQGSGCSSCTTRGNIQQTFDVMGNVVSATDSLGHVTTNTYDAANNLLSQTVQVNDTTTATTSYTYNSYGEVLTMTDPLGHVTTNAYDANGNLLSVTTPAPDGTTAASVTNFAYDSQGQLTTITDPLGHVTTMAYTPAGLIASITDAAGNVTSYQYDAKGNRTRVTDALLQQTNFTYDAMSRLTTITYPDSTTTTFAYDYRGRRTSVTDQNGKTTTYAYDDADRLTSVTDAANQTTTYAYDTENNLLSITDANANTTNFTYDAYGRVTQTNFPSALSEYYYYDANNNLTSKTDRKGQTIQYVYDALNRLTRKIYPDTTEVDYVYDLVGKIMSVNDPTGSYAFAYDNMGRLVGTTTSYSFLTGRSFTAGYAYDAASNRTGFTDPEGGATSYAYDALNRLATLTPSTSFTATGNFAFSYDALSRRTQMTRPNGLSTLYAYDSLSRLASVLHQAGGSTIDGATYTVDNAGNRTSKTDQRTAVATNYGYDQIYQLLSATQGATPTESYTYDPVGNRLSSLGASPYNYNASNQLTAMPGASYTYDANGNTVSKTDASGVTAYAWDYENRLASVALPGTGGTVSFKYDPFGRRIQKSSAGGTSVYAYDGDNTVEETNAAGGAVALYAQGLNIDEPLAMLRGGATSYYHADGLGSVTSLTNAAGALAQTYTFDSFGKLTGSSGSLVNPFQYTARESDPETGLYYYRARYYDSGIGRFISEDPIQSGPDYYAYVGNDPIDGVDPYGLKCIRKLFLVTAYCDFGPGRDWQFYRSKAKGGKPGSVGYGTIAVANSSSQPYPFGSTVTVDGHPDPILGTAAGDPLNPISYAGSVHDTGAGWDRNHHNVSPDDWIDIWLPCSDAKKWGKQWRWVRICPPGEGCKSEWPKMYKFGSYTFGARPW